MQEQPTNHPPHTHHRIAHVRIHRPVGRAMHHARRAARAPTMAVRPDDRFGMLRHRGHNGADPNWASSEYATREQRRPSDHMTPRRLRPCRHPMHSGSMSNTQTPYRTHTTALRMCAYLAPLVAQCIMLAALLLRQQWLFALMIGSGCCATAATMVLTLLQSRPTSFVSGMLRHRCHNGADAAAVTPHVLRQRCGRRTHAVACLRHHQRGHGPCMHRHHA